MTVKNIIEQTENMFGRQPEKYMYRLINDALNEIASKRQHNLKHTLGDLIQKKRWYDLTDAMIDVVKVEIKDTDGRYVMIPRLVDSHRLLKDDDISSDHDSLV